MIEKFAGNTPEDMQDILTARGAVVLDFYATWCGPCRLLSPIIEELAEENPDITFIKVDADISSNINALYGVTSLPTLIFFKNGQITARLMGSQPKNAIKPLLDVIR